MTETELTILSLVAEGPRYGYEIQQIIDERGLREWLAIGFSSIYYILNKLERQDLLTSELRFSGPGPARKVYQITEAGRGVLQTAVAELLRQPHVIGSGFELGLANLNAMSPKQVYKALTQHQIDLSKRLEAAQKSWARHQTDTKPVPNHIRALYTHSIAIMTAEEAWLKSFVDDWHERYPAVNEDDIREIPGSAPTEIHHRTTPTDPAKMIQRLKRPPRQ